MLGKTIRLWSTSTHHRPPYDRHHNQEGVGLQLSDISIYPQSSCAPEPSDQHNTCTPSPASAMIPQNQPISSCDLWPKPSQPLSMPSAKRLVAFWAVVAKHPGKNGVTKFTAWSDQPLVTLLPHTPFSPYATKEVPLASSEKVTAAFCGVVKVCVIECQCVTHTHTHTHTSRSTTHTGS